MLYEILTIETLPAKTGEAIKRIGAPPAQFDGETLLGFWDTDIGVVNRLVSLWGWDESGASAHGGPLAGARGQWFEPMSDLIVQVHSEHFRQFPFLPAIKPGRHGPFYEMRSYLAKPAGIKKTMEIWEATIPARTKLSPLLAALCAIDGALQKFVHIWPYASLDERLAIRSAAVKQGVWPPPGGPEQFTTMQNAILLPAPFSPLQ